MCDVLEVGFRFQFRVPLMMGDSSAFADKGSIMKHTALRFLIQSMQQNNVVEVVRDTGFYCHLFLVPILRAGNWRCHTFTDFYLKDLSLYSANFFQLGPVVAMLCQAVNSTFLELKYVFTSNIPGSVASPYHPPSFGLSPPQGDYLSQYEPFCQV